MTANNFDSGTPHDVFQDSDYSNRSASSTGGNQEIDLIDLFKSIWAKRRTIIKWSVIGFVAGVIIAFSLPKEYASTVKMAPENSKNARLSGMSSLASLAGVNLGNLSEDGINVNLYPDIAQSTPFLIEMSRIPVRKNEQGKTMSLYDYISDLSVPWWNRILGAPMALVGWIFGNERKSEPKQIDPFAPTVRQSRILQQLGKRITIATDKKSGILTAKTTMQDPLVAAIVADSLSNKLQEYIALYRTDKAKRDLEYTRNMFKDARDNYHEAQLHYAIYIDATQNVARQSVRAEQERLRNEQQLAYDIYSQLAQQLELSRMKVQEETPSVTIIEPASVPTRKANASKPSVIITITLLFATFSIGILIFQEILRERLTESSTQNKPIR